MLAGAAGAGTYLDHQGQEDQASEEMEEVPLLLHKLAQPIGAGVAVEAAPHQTKTAATAAPVS
jgi:hypothetical protein